MRQGRQSAATSTETCMDWSSSTHRQGVRYSPEKGLKGPGSEVGVSAATELWWGSGVPKVGALRLGLSGTTEGGGDLIRSCSAIRRPE